jgi:hypothetical protein
MTGFVEKQVFVFFGRSEKIEQDLEVRFHGGPKIVPAVLHQHRYLDPRSEMKDVYFGRVCLGQVTLVPKTPAQEDGGCKTLFEGRQ